MYLTSWIITTSKREKSSEESIILTKKLNNDFIITCGSAKWKNLSETMYNSHCLKNGSVALSQSIYFCNLRLGTSFNTWYLLPQQQVWNYLAYKKKKNRRWIKWKLLKKKKKLSLKALLPLIFPLCIKATPSTYLPNSVSFLTLHFPQPFSLLVLPYLWHSRW